MDWVFTRLEDLPDSVRPGASSPYLVVSEVLILGGLGVYTLR